MSEELKPCPLCGGDAGYGYNEAFSTDSSFPFVGCEKCVLMIEYNSNYPAEKLNAIAAWNTRVPDPRVKALVEATKAVSEGLEAHPDEPDRMLLTSSGFVRANKLLADLRVALAAMEE